LLLEKCRWDSLFAPRYDYVFMAMIIIGAELKIFFGEFYEKPA
jgi:hypothetical protein